jgi:hypothetical protein
MVDKERAAQMRLDGASFRKIGAEFGVSHQRIQQMLEGTDTKRRKRTTELERIPYEGLYQFMVANPEISFPRLAIIALGSGHHNESVKIRRFAYGKNCSFTKRTYDRLIAATGMTYEQLFKLRDGFTEADLEGGNGDG